MKITESESVSVFVPNTGSRTWVKSSLYSLSVWYGNPSQTLCLDWNPGTLPPSPSSSRCGAMVTRLRCTLQGKVVVSCPSVLNVVIESCYIIGKEKGKNQNIIKMTCTIIYTISINSNSM